MARSVALVGAKKHVIVPKSCEMTVGWSVVGERRRVHSRVRLR